MSRATVICDASFCPNTRSAGWATWINVNYPNGEHVRIQKSGQFNTRPRTSTHAEQMACLNGLWLAYHNGARTILIQTDCESLVRAGGAATRAEDYWSAAALYWPDADITWRHVKGHTGGKDPNGGDNRRFYVNEWCDREAKKQMKAQRRKTNGPRKLHKGSGQGKRKSSKRSAA